MSLSKGFVPWSLLTKSGLVHQPSGLNPITMVFQTCQPLLSRGFNPLTPSTFHTPSHQFFLTPSFHTLHSFFFIPPISTCWQKEMGCCACSCIGLLSKPMQKRSCTSIDLLSKSMEKTKRRCTSIDLLAKSMEKTQKRNTQSHCTRNCYKQQLVS